MPKKCRKNAKKGEQSKINDVRVSCMTEQDLLFSLDIGTRTVVGILGFHDGQRFVVEGFEIEEHKERVMYDGQVHDIEHVAKAVVKIKERLEKKAGVKLKRVFIAAAGRTLKTIKILVEQETDPLSEIDSELISSLEIKAIQQARKSMEKQSEEREQSYFCVGYAIVNYYLNGTMIRNLEGHKANLAGIEVIATFLPRIVVESLYSVVTKAGLEVSGLTLEPIAAMNVSINSSLRMLNLALVDIGAGTSDIALTKSGTVFTFAMASVAGDEITEKIAEVFLLDFDQAEKVKRKLHKETVKYKDIMGVTHERSSSEVLKEISPSIEGLAKEISGKILEFNGKSPSAVLLIGGGSQIPGLTGNIAECLQIPPERVGVRSTDIIKDIEFRGKRFSGPEFITPIGIAVTSYLNRQKDFTHVTVNGVNVKLFNSKTLTIADALIMMGYDPHNLICRRGDPLNFKLNEKDEVVKGESGESAVIYLNDNPAGLDKTIVNGDRIIVEPAVDGKPAKACPGDYIGKYGEKLIYLNEDVFSIKPVIRINGIESDPDTPIREGDEVKIGIAESVIEVLEYLDIKSNGAGIKINGREAGLQDSIYSGDQIAYNILKKQEPEFKCVNVTLNGKPAALRTDKSQCLFVDVLNSIEIDPGKIKGLITMLLNGNKANYSDVIRDGDIIEFYWEKEEKEE